MLPPIVTVCWNSRQNWPDAVSKAAAIVAASSVAAAPYDAELKQRYEAAKAEGKVVMYSVESIELIQELADAFKARFPGIDFDFFRGDSTQIAQRFEAEAAAGRHLSDVLMLTATDSENMTRDGLLLDTNSPVAKSYPAGTQPTNGYWHNLAYPVYTHTH